MGKHTPPHGECPNKVEGKVLIDGPVLNPDGTPTLATLAMFQCWTVGDYFKRLSGQDDILLHELTAKCKLDSNVGRDCMILINMTKEYIEKAKFDDHEAHRVWAVAGDQMDIYYLG